MCRRNDQKYLANHVIATKQAATEFECGMHCVAYGLCLSINYKISGVDKGRCELNNKTLQETFNADKEINPEFNHLYIIKKVKKLQGIEDLLTGTVGHWDSNNEPEVKFI